MKKRLFLILLSLCLFAALIPGAFAQEVELLEIPDDLQWDNELYSVTNLKTGAVGPFSCDIPENGAAVLIFFGPECPNSQMFFSTLNECAWVNNPYVAFSASNIADANQEQILAMVQENALNVYEFVDLYNPDTSWLAFDYYSKVSEEYMLTMPLIVVLTQSDSGRMVRYVEQAYWNAENLYEILCAVSPSFADYESKKESGEVESHIHSYGDWSYTLEPTCTRPGEEARVCDCGAKLTRPVEAFGHSTENGTLVKEPTQTEKGLVSYDCSRCGEKQSVELPALEGSATHSGDLNTSKPTKEDLHNAWSAISDTQDYFVEEPVVTAPYGAGQLTDALLDSGLSYFNYTRYAANLPEVQLSDEMNEISQHGAVVLAALDYGLDHFPPQPDLMDGTFYEIGYEATSTSNLHMRYGYEGNPLQYGVQGFLDDPGDNNMLSLGHRQWMLNPTLLNVGFGFARAQSGSEYILTKVHDSSGAGMDYDFISWPASGNFPTNVFSYDAAWSITLNPWKYLAPQVEDLVITMTRRSDGRTWLFNAGTGAPKHPDTYHLTVNTEGYGVGNCIIFAPGSENIGTYQGEYLITVSGIYDLDGTPASLCYEVDFFDAEYECIEHSYRTETVEPTCSNPGHIRYTCELCGHTYAENNAPMLEHRFTTEVIEPSCEWPGYILSVCELCGLNRQTDFTDPLGHSFVSEEVPPTCTNYGYTLSTCTVCGSQREENYVDPLGHTFVGGVCSCGATESDPTEPPETRPTEPAPTEPEETEPTEPIPTEPEETDPTEPTPTEPEETEPTEPEETKPTEPPCEHKWSKWDVTEPTSKKEGLRTRECAVCGEVEKEILSKLSGKFEDVAEDQYYALPVDWAVQKGVTTGMSATIFAPDAECTRGQIVTFLWRAAGQPEPSSSKNPFKDVKSSDYYYKAVLWAVEEGITTGTSADTFSPDSGCTRAQVATFLWRAQGKPAAASKNPFSDVKKGEYYYEAVIWAVENGVTTGTSATTFAPTATCTRGQIVTFLYRAIA